MDAAVTFYGGTMLIVPLRLWLVAGAICLAVIGGLALVTGHLSKIIIETGLISATIVFVFCAWIDWTIGWIENGH
jgi:hypothetical protein